MWIIFNDRHFDEGGPEMENIRLLEELLPKNLKKPAAFIAEKDPELPDYGVHTGDLVIVEKESEFIEGELSVFLCSCSDKAKYRISDKRIGKDSMHFGKIVMVLKYYYDSPLRNQM